MGAIRAITLIFEVGQDAIVIDAVSWGLEPGGSIGPRSETFPPCPGIARRRIIDVTIKAFCGRHVLAAATSGGDDVRENL